MKKCLLALTLLTIIATSSIAQEDEDEPKKGFDKSRLFFGGYLGASFGNYTLVNVSPQVGYFLNKYFAVGAGINFIYSSYKIEYNVSSYNTKEELGVVGLNIFGRFYPIQYIMLQAQPELNYVWGKVKYYDGSPEYKYDPEFVPSILLGGGVVIPTGGGRGGFTISVMYDVLQEDRSPYYKNAVWYFGYTFGF
jgi:hypothetical protein